MVKLSLPAIRQTVNDWKHFQFKSYIVKLPLNSNLMSTLGLFNSSQRCVGNRMTGISFYFCFFTFRNDI